MERSKPAPRTIILVWRDCDGNEVRERRVVYFEAGFGPHVSWNRRQIPVDATQDVLVLDRVGPKAQRPL